MLPLALALVPLLPTSLRTRDACMLCDKRDLRDIHTAAAASLDLGDASQNAMDSISALEERVAAHLRRLGAEEGAPPPPPGPSRSTFSISNSAARREETEARLRRLRQKDKGELESPNRAAIDAARSMAQQWLDAGLSTRAEQELAAVAPYVSYRSDLGGAFHLQLAAVVQACGKATEARKLRQRVAKDAESSSLRWQADRELQQGTGGTAAPSGGFNPELNSLFRMPSQWD
eukprot:CAMPEP_0183336032 /NCGR_PEP_ID=MMETSP0164_2-20130417/4137_1 /TAXON_ID=221442 /ORGANISM="Coccolithus pelagicus ssp braarudi, Strain PLY182g" /LENGTH=231 /DNA_ID=CAMNT_0025505483 /DNA_START=14 /DNA_END=709 /DNA_ORIENTATION=+